MLSNSRNIFHWWVDVAVDDLKVWQEVSGQVENPESPHDWVADKELEVPKSENFHLSLVKVSHSLENLHELHPRCLYHISLKSVLWNVPAQIDEKAVEKQQAQEHWSQEDLNFVNNSLLDVLKGAFEWDTLEVCRHFYQ